MIPERVFTILYGPGETLDDAIQAAGISPDPRDEIIALWSRCDSIPATSRLVAVSRDGVDYVRCMMAERKTVH